MSVMGNEFTGLPIADLIGGPLKAACDAQVRLAKATADFIMTVGFNPQLDQNNNSTGKFVPRQVDFSFWQPVPLLQKEVLASATITLASAAAGGVAPTASVSSIKVGPNAVDILGKPVPYTTSVEQTAKNVSDQINSYHSTPAFTAAASGATITITAQTGSGSTPNGWAVNVAFSDATLTANVSNVPPNAAGNPGALTGGVDAGGETKVQKVVLSVPFLAIVNVPALMVKTVNITFDMEVKTSESHHDSEDMGMSMDVTAKVGWGPFSAEVKIHGSISSHQENTRSTDRSAKYHIDVEARDDGMPEGLSRVLDILQKAIAPVSMSKPVALSGPGGAGIGQTQVPAGQ